MIRDAILIILILAGLGVIIFLDVPGVQGVLLTRKEIEAQKQTLLDKQDFLARVDKLSRAYEENKENIEKIEFILPTKEDIPNLLVQVESLVFEQGLLLEKLEVNSVAEQKKGAVGAEGLGGASEAASAKYNKLGINLGFTGDYSAFKNFLKAVEENMRLIDIDSIAITPESDIPGIFSFELVLKTYYQK